MRLGLGVAITSVRPLSAVPPTGPFLEALGVSPAVTTLQAGVPASGVIQNATAGSAIALSGAPTGFTINSAARTWAYSGAGQASSGNITLTETLAGATNTPRAASIAYAVAAASGGTGPTFPSTTDSSLPTPTLTLVTGQTTYPPQFDIGNLADAIVGDVLWLEQRDKAGSLIQRFSNTIDDAEAAAEAATFGLTGITTGTYRYYAFLARGSVVSLGSPVVIHGPDDVEPTLTLPTSSNVQSTSVTVGATTDEANGTLYAVATTTNSAPTAAQVEAGQNAAGTATPAGNVAVTSTGAKTLSVTGMTASTQYYSWLMHKDAAGNRSAVLNGADFTTSAAITALGWQAGSGDGGADGSITLSNGDFTATMTRAEGYREIYGQQSRDSGKRWIELTTSYPSGMEAQSGLIDAAAGKRVRYQSDTAAGDAGGGWNIGWSDDRLSTIRFEVDFDTQQIQAFIEGVSAGTKTFPAGATTFKAFAGLGYGVGPTCSVNTGNAATVGTPTAGFVAWGAP